MANGMTDLMVLTEKIRIEDEKVSKKFGILK